MTADLRHGKCRQVVEITIGRSIYGKKKHDSVSIDLVTANLRDLSEEVCDVARLR